MRRATQNYFLYNSPAAFQSTLSVRRATGCVTTHAPSRLISIHALREESDVFVMCPLIGLELFQSTLSVRRATIHLQSSNGIIGWISIHALREESDGYGAYTRGTYSNFNPRSPWGERQDLAIILWLSCKFQSTLSVRRATVFLFLIYHQK